MLVYYAQWLVLRGFRSVVPAKHMHWTCGNMANAVQKVSQNSPATAGECGSDIKRLRRHLNDRKILFIIKMSVCLLKV